MSAKFKSVGTRIKIKLENQDFQINLMEQSQPQERRAADQVFQESLEQLEDILQESLTEEEEMPELHTSTFTEAELDQNLTDIDLEALEDAVADIEKYLDEITKTKLG